MVFEFDTIHDFKFCQLAIWKLNKKNFDKKYIGDLGVMHIYYNFIGASKVLEHKHKQVWFQKHFELTKTARGFSSTLCRPIILYNNYSSLKWSLGACYLDKSYLNGANNLLRHCHFIYFELTQTSSAWIWVLKFKSR